MASAVSEEIGNERWQLPGYDIAGVLGRGGFATVFRARQRSLDRDVAIKVLTTDISSEGDRRRFDREREALARLSAHQYVVDVHDAGVSGGRPYIVMRLYGNGTLAQLIAANGPSPVPDVVGVISKLAQALDAAHRLGVVHRDIKPENVLLTDAGEPVLSDFGIAALVDPDGTLASTRASTNFFTLAHVAPEVLAFQQYSPASDIYALASTAYVALAGRAAFDPRNPRVASQILDAPPPAIGRSDLPPTAEAVIAQAMAKDPAQRYPTAGTFANALTQAVRDGAASRPTTPAPAPPPWVAPPVPGTLPPTPPLPPPQAPPGAGALGQGRSSNPGPQYGSTLPTRAAYPATPPYAATPPPAAVPPYAATPAPALPVPGGSAGGGRPPNRGLLIGGAAALVTVLAVTAAVVLAKPWSSPDPDPVPTSISTGPASTTTRPTTSVSLPSANEQLFTDPMLKRFGASVIQNATECKNDLTTADTDRLENVYCTFPGDYGVRLVLWRSNDLKASNRSTITKNMLDTAQDSSWSTDSARQGFYVKGTWKSTDSNDYYALLYWDLDCVPISGWAYGPTRSSAPPASDVDDLRTFWRNQAVNWQHFCDSSS